MEKHRKILVTAALPYANGSIHLGHLVEYLQADFWVRYQKLRGHDCRYFCADDTHGTPIFLNAKKMGISPEELVQQTAIEHKKDFDDFGIEFDNFSSTNTKTNQDLCNQFFKAMEDGGHIKQSSVDQSFCEKDSMFLPDRLVRGTCPKCKATDQWGDSCDVCGATYGPTDLLDPQCSFCGTPPVKKASEHLFFQLGDFKDFLADWIPNHNSKEVSAKLKEWLADGDLRPWDISRDAPYFGFEIPGHDGKYFYVWVDAPIGYIAAAKDWANANSLDYEDDWKEGSETELYHFIGKDIIYFHSLFWPAMLKAAQFRRPDQVFVHGFLTVNGTKMSKSKGTFIKARTYLDHCDPTFLRYYYGCKLSAGMDDIDLNLDDFTQRVNSDLVGKFINLGSRSAKILKTHFNNTLGSLDDVDEPGQALISRAREAQTIIGNHFEEREFSKGLVAIRDLIDETNRYFDEQAPWKKVKEDKKRAHPSLLVALSVFRIAAIYLTPILPDLSRSISTLFNDPLFHWNHINDDISDRQIQDFSHLLKRIDGKNVEKMVDASKAQ